MYLFSGRGVRLEPKKKASLRAEIGEPAPCGELVVPLHTLGTSRLETTVGMGGLLLKYAPLAVSGSKNHAVMSPVNGTLLRVETRRHPFYGQVPCALIRPSAQEEELPGARYDLQSITLDEMISAAKTRSG